MIRRPKIVKEEGRNGPIFAGSFSTTAEAVKVREKLFKPDWSLAAT
jgi:hypothetical protein